MKIRLVLKDPDGVYNAVMDQAKAEVAKIVNLHEDDRDDITEDLIRRTMENIKPWVKYEEYVTIEIDTTEQTAKVLPAT